MHGVTAALTWNSVEINGVGAAARTCAISCWIRADIPLSADRGLPQFFSPTEVLMNNPFFTSHEGL